MAEGVLDTGAKTKMGATGGTKWAADLGESLNKNVLEVVLEKDIRVSFIVSDSDCVNLVKRLGLDKRPELLIII
jgi:hypothetical protein